MARIESHPGLFGNPYMDTKSKTHEANPQKGFVVQINASENFGLRRLFCYDSYPSTISAETKRHWRQLPVR
jgi:hypothetical protein